LQRLNLLRMLTGTSWGAATTPLLHIYRALIRSVLEYGMEAYFFSSASSLEKLNKIQYAALRLCTRAMKSTPSICLLHSCDELPLHLKHRLLCLKYKAHLLTFSHHTTLLLISDSWHKVHPDDFPKFQLSKVSTCSPSTQSRWTFSMYMSLMHHTYHLGSSTGHTSISP